MIRALLYVGFAVESIDCTDRVFRDIFGLQSQRMEPDAFLGTDKGARIAFPNQCLLYLMESHQPESSISKHVREKGPGLERIALLTDDIEADVKCLRRNDIQPKHNELASTPTGRRFAVPPQYVSGVTVELVEPNRGNWIFDVASNISGILGLQHIGVAVKDIEASCSTFEQLFGLSPRDIRADQHGGNQRDACIFPGNECLWLHVTQNWGPGERVNMFLQQKGEGLEHLCLEVFDIREAVRRVTSAGIPVFDNRIFTNRPDGFEAFVCPEYTTGVTVELIEPYPTSRGYRPRK